MTTSQLEALLIDETLGELSEETSALLAAYLSHFPEHRVRAEEIRRAVGYTESAVVSRPLELESSEILTFPVGRRRFFTPIRMVASIALLGLALGAGFYAGKGTVESEMPLETADAPDSADTPSPWARYRVEGNGRLAVILPVDPNS